MSRVQTLKNAGNSTVVKLFELSRIHSKRPDTIVCIFEGEDEKYYGCRLTSSFGHEGWRGVNTGGRDAVLELRNSVLNHPVYKKCKFLCFIDKDYDDWLVNPDPERIYVTPCYSVENLYSNEICLSGILSAEFRVTDFNEYAAEHKACLDSFKEIMREAAKHTLEFNAWAKSRAVMVRDNKPPVRIFLNDVTASDLLELSLTSCTIKYDPTDISSVWKKMDNSMLDAQALSEARASLVAGNPTQDYRGKQQLQAFRLFLIALKNDFTAPGNIIFKSKNKLRIDIEDNKIDLLSTLSQYAQTPDCLRAFLNKNIVRYSA